MTAREVLDDIKARLAAATPGPWFLDSDGRSIYYVFHNGDTLDRDRLAEASGKDAEFIAAAPATVARLTAALEAVLLLASKWEARGEHDMAYSKTVQDEHIADFLLTDGATKVENARHIRNAIEGALKP